MSDRKQIVFLSLESWDDMWRRNQFVCAELARRGWEILFVGPQRDLTNALRRLQFGRLRHVPNMSPKGFPSIVVSTWTKWLPNSIEPLRAINLRSRGRFVRRQAERLNFERPILWINDHDCAALADLVPHRALVYDITDDWISMEQPVHQRRRTQANDAELCDRAHATIVCSERLRELKLSLALSGRVHLVPNGVEVEHYSRPVPSEPPRGALWDRPCFGYTGTIHPGRLDVGLVESVARRLTSGTIVLVGPDMLEGRDRERLVRTGRVRFVAAVPYAELPDWMSAMDVFIVPHKRDAFVESLNPIKLWEYLASGKPIVATSVPGFRERPELIRLADDAEAFHAQMLAALEEGDRRSEARRAVARENSWTRRVDQIEAIVHGVTW